jgi:hypothetical protein
MRTATQRIRQLFIGILAALSLSVSSVAVCACDHHVLDRQPERSCHATASEKQHDLADIAQTAPSFDESCVCVQKAIKLSVKAEGLKLKKQPSVLSGGFELAKPRFHSAIAFLASDHSLRHWDNPSTGSPSSRGPPVS